MTNQINENEWEVWLAYKCYRYRGDSNHLEGIFTTQKAAMESLRPLIERAVHMSSLRDLQLSKKWIKTDGRAEVKFQNDDVSYHFYVTRKKVQS